MTFTQLVSTKSGSTDLSVSKPLMPGPLGQAKLPNRCIEGK